MDSFQDFFPEIASKETLLIKIMQEEDIPDGDYLFFENYCTNPACQCEEVVFSVMAFKTDKEGRPISAEGKIASFHYSWIKPVSKNNPDFCSDSTRTITGEGVLKLLRKILKENEIYKRRCEEHYHKIRKKAQSLSSLSAKQFMTRISQGRNDTCACGSGKKYKKCCLLRESKILSRDE
jgi:hypothetical protein